MKRIELREGTGVCSGMMVDEPNGEVFMMVDKPDGEIFMMFDKLPFSAGGGMVFDFQHTQVGMMLHDSDFEIFMMFHHAYPSVEGNVAAGAVIDGRGSSKKETEKRY
jgi:hypothetical protein